MTQQVEKISIDRLAYELRSLSSMDVERLFDRLNEGELADFFGVAFADEINHARDLQSMLDDADAELLGAGERIEDLGREIADLKEDLRSVECARDFLQGRIHQLTGETFDD